MRLISFAISILALSMATSVAQENRTVEVVKASDFMAFPEDQQVLSLAGLVDGMAYMLFHYKNPEHDAWVACVRAAPLGDLLNDVNSFLKENAEYQKYPVSYSLSKAIGARRPC